MVDMSMPGLAHRRDHLIERHLVRAVAAHRQARRVDGLHRAHRVALDAGDLHQARDRVAGQPEVVLHADLGGVLDLLVACRASAATSPAAAMEQATPTSPWQPISAPEIEALRL